MKVITFYSYKGGVGRSMALANVAEVLYRDGKKVVIIDWDLEAPGIEGYYFNTEEKIKQVESLPGLMDILQSYKKIYPRLGIPGASDIHSQLVTIVRNFLLRSSKGDMDDDDFASLTEGTFLTGENTQKMISFLKQQHQNKNSDPQDILKGLLHVIEPQNQEVFFQTLSTSLPSLIPSLQRLRARQEDGSDARSGIWLLSSGMRSSPQHYSQSVQDFGWSDFYISYNGELYFEWFRNQLEEFADYILIDSRTGVTEMGGVCTQQLADLIVFVTAPNPQNVKGVCDMIRSVRREEIMALRKGRALKVIAIPSRIDSSELNNRNDFESQFITRLAPLIGSTEVRECWDLHIPYLAYYTYFDELVIGAMSKSGTPVAKAAELEKAYIKLADYITGNNKHQAMPVPRFERSSIVGLRPYATEDSAMFFGRGRELKEVLSYLESTPVVTISGPSGSGKSSFLRACVLPALNEKDPGSAVFISLSTRQNPYLDLVRAMDIDFEPDKLWDANMEAERALDRFFISDKAHSKKELILVIDQVEMALINNQEVSSFLYFLTFMNRYAGKLQFIFSVRSDYEDRFIKKLPAAGSAVIRLGTIEDSILKRAISEPTALSGISFEPGLIERILNDLPKDQFRLPILQLTLQKLHQESDSDTLKHAAYIKFGGASAVLSEYLLQKTTEIPNDPGFQLRVLSRLIAYDKRTQIELSDLNDEDLRKLDPFILSGLVCIIRNEAGAKSITLSHDVLLHRWTFLKEEISRNIDFIYWRNLLRHQLLAANGPFSGGLWQSTDVKDSKKWVKTHSNFLFTWELDQIARLNRRYMRTRTFQALATLLFLTILASFVIYSDMRESSKKKDVELEFNRQLTFLSAQSGPLRVSSTCALASFNNLYNSTYIEAKKDSLLLMCGKLEVQVQPIEHTINIIDNSLESSSRRLPTKSLRNLALIDSLEKKLNTTTAQLESANNLEKKDSLRKDSAAIEGAITMIIKYDSVLKPLAVKNDSLVKMFFSINKFFKTADHKTIIYYDSSLWLKQGYYRQFDGIKVSLTDLKKDQMTVEVAIDVADSVYQTTLVVDEGRTDKIDLNGYTYAITLDKIGRAGRNPFTPAAYITFVIFRNKDKHTTGGGF